MKKLRFLVSLTTDDNDYQIEQAQSAEDAARKFGVELQVIYADNDAITQRSEEHTSELQSRLHLVCRLLLEKKKSLSYTTAAPYSCDFTCFYSRVVRTSSFTSRIPDRFSLLRHRPTSCGSVR